MCVIFWIGSIGGLLYLPRLVEHLGNKKSLNVLLWPSLIDVSKIKEFEQKTGIKVYVTYFENNEELVVKLKSGGGEGYDLVSPADYGVDLLLQAHLLSIIDTSKLNFWDKLYDGLKGHYFDPENQYSVPFNVSAYVLGVDLDYFGGQKPPATWSLIFDDNLHPERVGMLNDVREITSIASLYLFGPNAVLNNERYEKIIQLLVRQKKWVEIYSDLRADYLLLTKACPVVVGIFSEIARNVRGVENIELMIPQEGTFCVIDSFVIPKASKNKEYAYAFLNWLYSPEVAKHNVDLLLVTPPRTDVALPETQFKFLEPTKDLFKHLHFFRNVVPQDILNMIWVRLKS